MYKTGTAHGRFQGLHLEHLEYLLEAKKRCEHLFVGITNYEPYLNTGKQFDTNKNRTKIEQNPFTYFERLEMIKGSLLEAGVPLDSFDIVPFPLENPQALFNFVPKDAVFFTTIRDDWNREKVQLLKSLGCEVEVLWERTDNKDIIRGTEIRNLIKEGKTDWGKMVPPFVYNYICENKIDDRIRSNERTDIYKT